MKAQWQPLIKLAFLYDIMKLPAKDMHQIMEKITMLTQDPRPDSKVKKQLVHCPGKPHRIRSGDYRIFYTFSDQVVTIYKIDRRHEGTYKDCPEAEYGPSADVLNESSGNELADVATTTSKQPDWERIFAQPESKPLPEPITVELLTKLKVPEAHHARLTRVADEDGIYNCRGVSDDVLIRLHDYMFSPPLPEVMQQQDMVLSDVKDLLLYKEGELLTFLLKLSPEQERYASWSLNTSGPTLVKGGPGTGKSTVALYRIRSLLDQLLKKGQDTPRILFTTYTHALVRSSQQLLQRLLGENAHYVQVDTADSVVYSVLNDCRQVRQFSVLDNRYELPNLTMQAIAATVYTGSPLQKQAKRQTIENMGLDYLLQEINTVIVARQIPTLESYLKTPRNGRKLRLNATQRIAVWTVYEQWCAQLSRQGKETWEQRRARAASLVAQSSLYQHYDAVVIDEAQDLDPSVLRMLVQLCKMPERVFITADANQSIYGSGFSWSDVHESLRFQGRTSILRANYRSTAEIGEATQSYLTSGQLDPEPIERHYINNGPLPDARSVLNHQHEIQLLASYFRKASRSLRLTPGSCAVLVPSENAGRAIANALNEQGIEATYMAGRELDLSRSGVKVLTLKSSKGLEFPIVALAGFTLSNYPAIPLNATGEEIEELLTRERRTIFVGMTRAMRALLVVIPHDTDTPLLQGFDATYWNFTRNI